MICSGGMEILAISISQRNRCHQPLPRSMDSVPSIILSVSCAVGRRLASRIAVGTETNSAMRLRTVPFFGPERSINVPSPISPAATSPTTVMVTDEVQKRTNADGL